MIDINLTQETGWSEMNLTNILIILLILLILFVYAYYAFNSNKSNSDVLILDNKNEIIYDFINNKKYNNFTIIHLLKHISKQFGSKTALKIKQNKKHKWKSVSYSEYYENILNFAESINEWLGSNVNVAIFGFNSPGWFYAHMGCMLNGGTSIGIYPTSTGPICEHIINDSQAELLVVGDDKELEKILGLNIERVKLIVYYSPITNGMVDKFEIPVISMGNFMTKRNKIISYPTLDKNATIIYTSGTTDLPKGAIITHANIMLSIKEIIKTITFKSSLGLLKNERFISYLPLNHIAAQMTDVYLPIITVSSVWFADKNALKNSISSTIIDVKPTIFTGVPRTWEKIVEAVQQEISNKGLMGTLTKTFSPSTVIKKMGLDKCKLLMNVAAPISTTSYEYLDSLGLTLYNTYGMSETCGSISMSLPGINRKGSVGLPIIPVKIGKDNEIMVSGPTLFKGYVNTKSPFTKDKWFATGDFGMIDSDGYLYVIGRKKELIITAGGENINPLPIENLLKDKLGSYFDHIIVVGDKKKYLCVVFNTPKKILGNINEIIDKSIDEINTLAQSNSHTIKKWTIINDKFIIGDELTPTLKLRRQFIQNKYKKQIDKMYIDKTNNDVNKN